ncbi:MAG: GAF domain-containing protein, partial [Phycisphaerae bacterium]|nr:GAF domain-containing protein [Phycisphaerae bacterium]
MPEYIVTNVITLPITISIVAHAISRPDIDSSLLLLAGLLLAIVISAAVALLARQRQRLQETLRAHLNALDSLQTVATLIGVQERPSDELFRQLLEAACRLLAVPKGFVCRLEEGGIVRRVCDIGFHDPPMTWETRTLDELPGTAHCIRSGQDVCLYDVKTDLVFDQIKLARYHLASILMFPLKAGTETIGIMVLGDRVPREFTEQERQLARLWAAQAAVTLANQRLARTSDQALRKQQQLNEQITRDAEMKEMLLREMNHRVKNNMAGIIGLLSGGSPELSEGAHRWLDRAISRIQTLARAHDLFIGFTEDVSLRDLIEKTLIPIHAMMPAGAVLAFEGIPDVQLSADRAITLAMVLNEVASNSLEHGIGDNGILTIRVSIPGVQRIRIEVVDDASRAVGVSPDGDAGFQDTGVGLELVRGLVGRELRGTFQLTRQ